MIKGRRPGGLKEKRRHGDNGKRSSAPKRSTRGKGNEVARTPPRLQTLLQSETTAQKQARAARVLAELRRAYPEAACALRHSNAYELLVATILSAQCTDERVNKVTPALFRRLPTVERLADAPQADVEAIIRSCGFFRNKAKNLIGMARRVMSEYGGEIPSAMDQLLTLPGVARKTANCVLGTWFHINDGVVVDTHVGRIAHRQGFTATSRNTKDAENIEYDLTGLFPKDSWTYLSHALIAHGRAVCTARSPKCGVCSFATQCPSAST